MYGKCINNLEDFETNIKHPGENLVQVIEEYFIGNTCLGHQTETILQNNDTGCHGLHFIQVCISTEYNKCLFCLLFLD